MGQRSKTHHFLPQMILRGFATDDRVMTVELGDGRSYVQPVAKAAAENNYNTVELDGGTQSDVAERFIAEEIESPAAAVLARIAAGGWFFDAAERASVARFLTLQYLRVPWRRAQSNAMADWLMKLDLAAGGPNELRRGMEKRTGHPVTDQDVAEVWASVRDFDDWKLALSREHHVIDSLRMVDEFAPGVAGIYEWAVMRWEHKRILTSDSPVLLQRHRDAQQWQGVGLLTAGSIWFPIDRRTALVLVPRSDERGFEGRELPPSAAAARRLNRGLVLDAYQRFYHHPDDTLDGLLGAGFELPKPAEPGIDSDHNNELRDALRSMAEWHFEHPDQPHPMSGKTPHPDSGIEPWTESGGQPVGDTAEGADAGDSEVAG